ncbi:MAG: hypothetical protein Q8K75_07550 [Chlamydiales bacterium]|nr:hypothetical protein [Chlamydiales bacterium]
MLDKVNSLMSPATSTWANTVDFFAEKRGAFLTTRIVAPTVILSAYIDAVCHVAACVFKTLYALITGTLEILFNAFTVRWRSIDPLNAPTFNRGEAARHLVKAIECVVAGTILAPVGAVVPDWATGSMRYFKLASPHVPKPKVEEAKPATFADKVGAFAKGAFGYAAAPFNAAYKFAKGPMISSLAVQTVSMAALGAGAVGAAAGANKMGWVKIPYFA